MVELPYKEQNIKNFIQWLALHSKLLLYEGVPISKMGLCFPLSLQPKKIPQNEARRTEDQQEHSVKGELEMGKGISKTCSPYSLRGSFPIRSNSMHAAANRMSKESDLSQLCPVV